MIILITEWVDRKVTESLEETQEILEKGLYYVTTFEGSLKLERAFKKEKHYFSLYEKFFRYGETRENGRLSDVLWQTGQDQ
jgi:hypothetical protein